MKSRWMLLTLLWPLAALADEALPQVLARLRQDGEGKFQYQETRTLELATAPWQGQGYMLTDGKGSLVKLQLAPQRVIMAVSQQRLYYYDPSLQQRHELPLDYADPAAGQIVVFRSLLQGRSEDFQADYAFAAEQHDAFWRLTLTPKTGHETAARIEIAGDDRVRSRQITILQADGDSTVYRIEPLPVPQAASVSIDGLLREAVGD